MPTSRYWRSGKLPAALQRSCQEAQELFTRAYRSAAQLYGEVTRLSGRILRAEAEVGTRR